MRRLSCPSHGQLESLIVPPLYVHPKAGGSPSLPPHDKNGNLCIFVDYTIGNTADDRGG
jgi:hypothetical protein